PRCADVERESGMVFGISGRGVDREDVLQVLPARALALEDAELVVVAAVGGNGFEHDAVAQRGVAQVAPCAGGVDMQPQWTAKAVGPGEGQPRRFGDQDKTGAPGVSGRVDAEPV